MWGDKVEVGEIGGGSVTGDGKGKGILFTDACNFFLLSFRVLDRNNP